MVLIEGTFNNPNFGNNTLLLTKDVPLTITPMPHLHFLFRPYLV